MYFLTLKPTLISKLDNVHLLAIILNNNTQQQQIPSQTNLTAQNQKCPTKTAVALQRRPKTHQKHQCLHFYNKSSHHPAAAVQNHQHHLCQGQPRQHLGLTHQVQLHMLQRPSHKSSTQISSVSERSKRAIVFWHGLLR